MRTNWGINFCSAGRRGLDKTGTVLLLCKGVAPAYRPLQRMMLGEPCKLTSHFRVTYPMLLNVLRVEHMRVEDVLQRSYTENGMLKSKLPRRARCDEIHEQLHTLQLPDCQRCMTDGSLQEYHDVTIRWVVSLIQ